MNSQELLSAAIRYAELGYPVFPCVPRRKNPITPHGFKDATTNPAQIEAWWDKHPDANVGVATQGLLVVDVDNANNPWPMDEGQKLELANCTASSITPSGGRHYIYKQPDTGGPYRNTTSKIALRVDTRADGGYIVVPPSVAGKPYVWTPSCELEVGPGELQLPPQFVLDILARGQRALPSLVHSADTGGHSEAAPSVDVATTNGSDAATEGGTIYEGNRNDTLTRLAGVMRRGGFERYEIEPALLAVNRSRCKPQLGPSEVAKIAKSVSRYEPDQITVAVVEDHYGQDRGNEPVAAEPAYPDPGTVPVELLRVPGFVSELMDCTMSSAPYPNQAMSFCGALAMMSMLAGRKVRDPGDNRTNIYLLALGHSASGKDWPRKVNSMLAHRAGLTGNMAERFASGEGIQDALFISPCMLFQTDEIDGILQSINKSTDARYEGIMNTLLTVYSSSNSVMPMRRKAGLDHPGSIDQPNLTVLGTAIPNHYYAALSERMLTNGFFARTMVIECGKRASGQAPTIIELPDRLVETATWWRDFQCGGVNLAGEHPEPVTVEHKPGAKAALAENRLEAEALYAQAEARNDMVGTTVWGRVNENVRKLALLYAVSESNESPIIGTEGVDWAACFVMHQAKRMLFMAQAHVAENEFDAKQKKVVRIIRDAGGSISRNELCRKTQSLTLRERTEIINNLKETGQIVERKESTGGRGKTIYALL